MLGHQALVWDHPESVNIRQQATQQPQRWSRADPGKGQIGDAAGRAHLDGLQAQRRLLSGVLGQAAGCRRPVSSALVAEEPDLERCRHVRCILQTQGDQCLLCLRIGRMLHPRIPHAWSNAAPRMLQANCLKRVKARRQQCWVEAAQILRRGRHPQDAQAPMNLHATHAGSLACAWWSDDMAIHIHNRCSVYMTGNPKCRPSLWYRIQEL